jgi:hypothetical protein
MKNLLFIILFFVFLLTNSYANIDDKINKDLNKSFKKYEKEIKKIQKKISNLKKNQSKDIQKIDLSLQELDRLVDFSKNNLSLEKQDILLDSLNLIDLYIKDISKLIPKEIVRKVPENENDSMNDETLKTMMQLTSASKSKQQKKKIKILKSIENLRDVGVDLSSINESFKELEIDNSIPTVEEITSLTNDKEDLSKTSEIIPPEYKSLDPNMNRLKDFATVRTLQNYDYSWEKNDYRISVGRPVDEALDVKQAVYDEAIKFGFSEDKANILASNAYSAYYDMWFHGSEIVEQTRASGGSWEESDGALDEWLQDPNNQFNKWALNFYRMDDPEDKYLPNPEALKDWFSKIGDGKIETYELSEDRLNKEAMARTVSYLTQDFMPGQGEGEGNPYSEADEVAEIVKKLAIDRGFSDAEADILGANAASTYLDIWLDGTYVMEKALAAGKTYDEADLAVEKWAMNPNNNYMEWFERWGEADPEKDWIPDESTFGAYLDSLKGNEILKFDPSETRADLEISMRVYESINFNTDTGEWEGEVFDEAKKVSDAFYERAINDFKYSKDDAEKIRRNVWNNYVDTWTEGTYVSESVRYKGGSWEDADAAVEKWYSSSKYKNYWKQNEKSWGIIIEEDDEGNIKIIYGIADVKTIVARSATSNVQENIEKYSNKSLDEIKADLEKKYLENDDIIDDVKQKLIDGELARIADHIFKYQDFDLKSLTEGELKEAIAEAANATGEAIEGTVAGSGQGLNPSTGPRFGGGENDPDAATCLGCKYVDPEGD